MDSPKNFQLRKNWRPGIKDTSDDEDIIIDGSGNDILDHQQPFSDTQHSLIDTWLPCCEIGSSVGACGILCDAELHYNKLASGVLSLRLEYEKKLDIYLKQRGKSVPMLLFKQCIERRPNEFYKCCSAAKSERRENQRWNKFKPPRISNKKQLAWRFVNG
ncbi:hypothetical protein LOTGIDRAFT_156491 [Lottia gigantea]|uniref:Uncharacterized protein n=1 Tax=Lottia gigantea TaxID=225164 RepID=V4B0X0_LOTGI|nr:hypothetical protein LOTGIDRAFT_156491 [Lottia gigantea]ESP03893.1 hypothetical protein LOTGIDRAFT_156491 [Lottia gigantea]